MGYRPSRKNPNLCATCVELAPPGGATMEAGVLFADVRGFTALSEGVEPERFGALLEVGYGTPDGPFVEVGLDFGEAFVGNIGERAVHDFTAVGDVVNTASRLQGEARGGEILISGRLAGGTDQPLGVPVELALAGRSEPVVAYRVDVRQ